MGKNEVTITLPESNETITLDERRASTPTRQFKTARMLFGVLNVPGVQWVGVNVGLCRIECSRCKGFEIIEEKDTFGQFRTNVQLFATYHSDCHEPRASMKVSM